MYLNKVFVLGNLTRDPELKALPSGMQVCSFSIATNSVYKDKDGNKKETAEFHNIVSFGRQGELIAQYLRKGSQALIEGRIQTRSWDQDGQKRYRTEIIADRVQFGDRKSGGEGGGYTPNQQNANTPAKKDTQNDSIDYPEEEINPDDIPF
jgi:single-strand DNA-binding protein